MFFKVHSHEVIKGSRDDQINFSRSKTFRWQKARASCEYHLNGCFEAFTRAELRLSVFNTRWIADPIHYEFVFIFCVQSSNNAFQLLYHPLFTIQDCYCLLNKCLNRRQSKETINNEYVCPFRSSYQQWRKPVLLYFSSNARSLT